MNLGALISLWNMTQVHVGTSGARAAAGVLLSLYNGERFQCDLTDLRLLDADLVRAAVAVIECDANRCEREVHEWLNRITGRRDFGQRFEHLAHQFQSFKRGRCKTDELRPLDPPCLVIRQPAMSDDALFRIELGMPVAEVSDRYSGASTVAQS